MSLKDSKTSKLQTHFQALSEISSSLNTASDVFARAITCVDQALNKLNVGLTVWVTFRARDVEETELEYDEDQVGYTKIRGKWGLALRRVWGNSLAEEHAAEGPWFFNDAPRELRLAAVDKIPEVAEQLGKEAFKFTREIQKKTSLLQGLTAALADSTIEPLIFRPNQPDSIGASVGRVKELERVRAVLRKQQKFLWSMVEHASRWELNGSEFRMYFPAESRALAEMLQARDPITKLKSVLEETLGHPVQVIIKLDANELTAPSTERGK